MKIKKAELADILQKIKPGLSKRDIIEQFTHFIFTGEAAITYNDEICISHPLETDFICSAKSEEFYKAINSIDTEDLEIFLKEGKLNILSEKAKGHLLTTPDEDDADMLIEALDIKSIGDQWRALPTDFIRGMSLCMFSSSKDLTKGIYTCVSINGHILSSSDGIRISIYEMEDEIVTPVLIPAVNIVELVKFDIKEYFISESWAHFRTEDNVIFSSRIMEGNYPALEEYFDISGDEIELPPKLRPLIESITFMVEGKVELDRFIDVYISPKKILCRAEKKGIGEFEKEMDFESPIEDLHLVVNPNFLTQILEKATTMVISENSVLFNSFTFNHIISLV